MLTVSCDSLARWRQSGDGPRYVRLGGRIRYRWTDVLRWLDAQGRESVADDRARGDR